MKLDGSGDLNVSVLESFQNKVLLFLFSPVISRNILTEPSLSSRDDPAGRSDSTPPEPNQSEPVGFLQQPMESSAAGDTPPAENQSGNVTETEASAHKRHSDPTKPGHTDEM